MSKRFFGDIGPVRFEGQKSDNPYAYRHYDPSRVVMGKTMAEHLRPAVCYWHNFAWMGTDMFGAPTFERPWDGETMKGARAKADAAFEMFTTLGFPFFTFHDRDVVPEGESLKEFGKNLAEMTDLFADKMQKTGHQASLGHRQSLQPSALPRRRRHQSRSRRVRLRRGAGEKRRSRRRRASAAPITCCGAAARATKRCSTPICAASRISSGAFSPWSSSTSTRSATRA